MNLEVKFGITYFIEFFFSWFLVFSGSVVCIVIRLGYELLAANLESNTI